MRRHGIAEHLRDEIARLSLAGLRAAIPDPCVAAGGDTPIVLATVPCVLPEVEFHFTYAADGALFPDARPDGYVVGYIDLLFRTGGRYYILDWKSDTLPDYSRQSIEACIAERGYDIQRRLYSLALHRWLQKRVPEYDPDRHFGGVIYAFLRGMKAGTAQGVSCTRPTSEDLQGAYPESLRAALASTMGGAR
jgi:exodeoxyribonuclease V beta subunit